LDGPTEIAGAMVFDARNASPSNIRTAHQVKAKVSHQSVSAGLPPLDFSFCELKDVSDLCRVAPRTGAIKNESAPSSVEVATTVTADDEDAPTGLFGLRGHSRGRPSVNASRRDDTEDGEIQRTEVTYQAYAVKLSNNSLSNIDGLMNILNIVVLKAYTMITWLDISFNTFSSIPADLSSLPLQVLNMHVNKIASMEELTKLQPLTTLRKLTLQGNPIESTTRNYKYHVLFLLPQVKSLDYATVTPNDMKTVESFRKFFVADRSTKKGRRQPLN